jgi:hypothetical protein
MKNIDFKKLEELIEQRDSFLKENPHLMPLQLEIDTRMKGAINRLDRNLILQNMMYKKVQELKEALDIIK